ncbi:hypothetical protein ACFL0Y_04800, partial [Patescibacteria group bacterium]
SRRFDPSHPVFLAIFVFLSTMIFDLLIGKPWLGEALIMVFLSIAIRPILKYYSQTFDRETIRLRV